MEDNKDSQTNNNEQASSSGGKVIQPVDPQRNLDDYKDNEQVKETSKSKPEPQKNSQEPTETPTNTSTTPSPNNSKPKTNNSNTKVNAPPQKLETHSPQEKDPLFPQAFIKVFTNKGLEYLFFIIVLVVLVFSLFGIGEDVIGYLFGDRTASFYSDGFLFADVAALVSLGVVILLGRKLTQAERENPELMKDPSRKRIAQLGLRIAYIALLVVVATFLYRLLNYPLSRLGISGDSQTGLGELLTVSFYQLSLAGLFFWYMFRMDRGKGLNFYLHQFALIGLAGFTLLMTGFQYSFPEKFRRDVAIDRQIVKDLKDINKEIKDFEGEENELPDSIEDLEPKDVLLRRAEAFNYTYDKESSNSYELCATFKRDSDDVDEKTNSFSGVFESDSITPTYQEEAVDFSDHSSGEECFEIELAPSYDSYDFDYEDYFNSQLESSTQDSTTR